MILARIIFLSLRLNIPRVTSKAVQDKRHPSPPDILWHSCLALTYVIRSNRISPSWFLPTAPVLSRAACTNRERNPGSLFWGLPCHPSCRDVTSPWQPAPFSPDIDRRSQGRFSGSPHLGQWTRAALEQWAMLKIVLDGHFFLFWLFFICSKNLKSVSLCECAFPKFSFIKEVI